ncbi:FUSC family protein [Arthrobacter sp. I2-34]|uniref:FUSC family protein n=1 Tax=Arthrobacter hankyongi TaxID=2904801 RepID=A0ABS9L9G3_9MICC|nr:FUSC family protein [Arthrobacter hankyongi]MCG2623322.1 FUSC family protein [Arthrobacter hankyongi]
MGAPILAGLLLGSLPTGLMATLGAFTALYGSGRPYLNRAGHLALIAVSFALSVSIGIWASGRAITVVGCLTLLAMAATFLCSARQVEPPGAYMFVVACAAGTALPAAQLTPFSAGVVVLAGGVFAWLVHMAGALFSLRGPEKSAVAAAANAVAAYLEVLDTERERPAHRRAAAALQRSWQVLVQQQPLKSRADSTLRRLRGLNRRLHLLAAAAAQYSGRAGGVPPEYIRTVRHIAGQAAHPPPPAVPHGSWPILEPPGFFPSLWQSLKPGSPPVKVALRVGAAALIAGAIASSLALDRAYWAVAAAVLMLHTGMDWLRTLQRSLERFAGTLGGIGLTAVIFWWHPQGFWLLAVVMLLQFTIEMLVVRNYALAAVFITATALTIGSGGQPVPDPSRLLQARVEDTALGCAVALLVFRLLTPRDAPTRIPAALAGTVKAVDAAALAMGSGRLDSAQALRMHGRLQQSTLRLAQAYDAAVGGSAAQRDAAEKLWPATAAAEQLAFRVLAAWTIMLHGGSAAGEGRPAVELDADGAARLHQVLSGLAAAAETGRPAAPLGKLPAFLRPEVHAVHEALQTSPERSPARGEGEVSGS